MNNQTNLSIKCIGLTEEMIAQLGKDEDLQCLIKLHETVQKVKQSNDGNAKEIRELKELFNDLQEKIHNVFKEQSNTSGASLAEKKKEDMKKTK